MQVTQIIGEKITYQQPVIGDSISSADWSVSPDGPTISEKAHTLTSASCKFSSSTQGDYLLSATVTLASGQIRIGQVRIQVAAVKV